MNETVVDIVLHGLIALVPIIGPNQGVEMQALLVDSEVAWSQADVATRESRQFGLCHEAHVPEVRIEPIAPSQCRLSMGCTWHKQKCTCPLNRMEIELTPAPVPRAAAYAVEPEPERVLPFSGSDKDGGNLAYVPDLTRLGATLNMAVLAPNPPEIITSRFRFPYDSIVSCDLATREDEFADHVHAFSFRGISKVSEATDPVQAGAQQVAATITLTHGGDETPALVLRPIDSGEPLRFELRERRMKITVMNHRSKTQPGDPCDDGIGRDFAMFYDLANEENAWSSRPIPHVKPALFKSFLDVKSETCEKIGRVVAARPVCMMTRFAPVHLSDTDEEPAL